MTLVELYEWCYECGGYYCDDCCCDECWVQKQIDNIEKDEE